MTEHKRSAISGFLVLDKPLGLTSRDAVDRAMRWLPRKVRLGHTGTLDPLATGVLVVAFGVGTRLTDYVQQMEKVYETTVRLGATSDTDDGEATSEPTGVAPPERGVIESALKEFVGVIDQVPPVFSAAKVAGRRAYLLARRGAEVDLTARPVQIHELRVLDYSPPNLVLEVRCGKGTYIRSLARDLGERLGCGGYVHALRRTRIGPFTPELAVPLGTDRETALHSLLDLSWVAHGMPRIEIAPEEAERFAHGQKLPHDGPDGEVGVFVTTGRFVGIGDVDEGRLRPCKVFWDIPNVG